MIPLENCKAHAPLVSMWQWGQGFAFQATQLSKGVMIIVGAIILQIHVVRDFWATLLRFYSHDRVGIGCTYADRSFLPVIICYPVFRGYSVEKTFRIMARTFSYCSYQSLFLSSLQGSSIKDFSSTARCLTLDVGISIIIFSRHWKIAECLPEVTSSFVILGLFFPSALKAVANFPTPHEYH